MASRCVAISSNDSENNKNYGEAFVSHVFIVFAFLFHIFLAIRDRNTKMEASFLHDKLNELPCIFKNKATV